MTIPTQMVDALKVSTPAQKSELRNLANGLAVMLQLYGVSNTTNASPAFRGEAEKHAAHSAAFRDMVASMLSPNEQSRLARYGRERGTTVLTGLPNSTVAAIGTARSSDPIAHIPKTAIVSIKNTLIAAANGVPPQYRQPFLELATRLQNTTT